MINSDFERNIYYLAVANRGDQGVISRLSEERFLPMSRFMIDQGFQNLLSEWYAPGTLKLPDLYKLFVYWEDPDTAPSFEQIRAWGSDGVSLEVEE